MADTGRSYLQMRPNYTVVVNSQVMAIFDLERTALGVSVHL